MQVVELNRMVARARRYARGRRGVVSFALIAPDGRVRGYRSGEQFVSASVVKAMLLVAYLRGPASGRSRLSGAEQARLGAMIRVSDNDAATSTYHAVGDRGLRDVARRAGMRHFSVRDSWGYAQITAGDQARFFARLDALVPRRHRAFVRRQLSSITPAQRWGIPERIDAGDRIWFKGGWRGTGRGQLVHQVATVQHDGARWSVAILTDGNPSHGYGVETIRGVAERLLPR